MGISDLDIEMKNAQADMEIKNSPALQGICLSVSFLRKQVEQLNKRITELETVKTCGMCEAVVHKSKWHLVYPVSRTNAESGVCESCWQKHYAPYI